MLQLVGWSLAEEDLEKAVKRWEREHKNAQAACWLVFTKQYKLATDVLMRSKGEHSVLSQLSPAADYPGAQTSPII